MTFTTFYQFLLPFSNFYQLFYYLYLSLLPSTKLKELLPFLTNLYITFNKFYHFLPPSTIFLPILYYFPTLSHFLPTFYLFTTTFANILLLLTNILPTSHQFFVLLVLKIVVDKIYTNIYNACH